MKITYAVTVCNEFIEIQRLIRFLLENKRIQDDIVVLYDAKNGDSEIESFLRANSINGEFSWHKGEFEGNFADWKNKLTSLCTGDYIFQIDADELPNESLIQILPDILEKNNGVDLIWVPRVNTVYGLTAEHIKRWGWAVNGSGWVNWPDWQGRIYKNHPSVCWENPVHEKLGGIRTFANLPADVSFALHHPKTIERQVKQNEYYETL